MMMTISQVHMLPLWAGYAFIGALSLTLATALLSGSLAWRDLFRAGPGEPQHASHYLVVFGTLWLAARFLSALLTQPGDVRAAVQIFDGFDAKDAVGTSSALFLLAKVTNGQILSLFRNGQ